MEYTIKEVRVINGLAVVIYKFEENGQKHRQFKNCNAFDKNGKQIWTADSYVEFMNGNENRIWNFGGFICEFNFQNGKLKNYSQNKYKRYIGYVLIPNLILQSKGQL